MESLRLVGIHSLGTLAFILGSQKLIAQVRTDIFDVMFVTMLLLLIRRSDPDGHGSDNVYYVPCCRYLSPFDYS
jgi:hypothetical protein